MSVIPSSTATSFERNRANGRPRRRSTIILTMLRASTNTSARIIVRSASDSAVEHELGEEVGRERERTGWQT